VLESAAWGLGAESKGDLLTQQNDAARRKNADRHRPSFDSWALCALVLCIVVVASAPAVAAPTTPEIEAKRAAAASAQADLDRMNDELEVRVEEYNAITEALEQTRAEIRETQALLEAARRQLTAASDQLARRATSIYKDGGTGMLDVLLGTRSFQDLIVRVDLAVRINRQDAALVASVKDAKVRVETTERALQTREAEQTSLRGQAEARREQIEAAIAEQEAYVATLDKEIKRLVAEEQERQRPARRGTRAPGRRGCRCIPFSRPHGG